MELSSAIRNCHGVDRELSGVVWELSSVIRSCHGVEQELSWSGLLSPVVVLEFARNCHGFFPVIIFVMELTRSFHGVILCHQELSWS